ncbi:MAG: fibronectin type III domain-containing protein [Candidatus Helarchaeota archaeon]
MTLLKNRKIYLLLLVILGLNLTVLHQVHGSSSILLNNFADDYEIDGFVSVWHQNMTDQQDISVRFDSSLLRLVTGVRLTYRTQNLLNPKADCNVSYKFESGEFVYYNDILWNTTGKNWTHSFYCQGDTFLLTNTSFYVDLGCVSDDPYIQVGFDNDHSGHSMYSLNGGPWTPDTVEYLIEAIVENVTDIMENSNISGEITGASDFVDGYRISLSAGDVCHFYVESADAGEHFNLRFFPLNTILTSDGNTLWMEEESTEAKAKQYSPVAGEYILLVEPNVDGVDNGTYHFYWTYDPEPPIVSQLPIIVEHYNVSLTWNASLDDDVVYYNIYRGNSTDFPLNSGHLISPPGTVTGTSFNDIALLPNDQYFYSITAVDATGHQSIKSNIVNTTLLDTTPPNPPSNLTINHVRNQIVLNWSAPSDQDISFYSIFRFPTATLNISKATPIVNTPLTSWIDVDIPPGTYYYVVITVDLNGLPSNSSNAVSITISTSPPYAFLIPFLVVLCMVGIVGGRELYTRQRDPHSKFHKINPSRLLKIIRGSGSYQNLSTREKGILFMNWSKRQFIRRAFILKQKFRRIKD